MRRLVSFAVVVSLLACASAAHARDVTLWACHGPSGEALGTPAQGLFDWTGTLSGSCDAPGSALSAGAMYLFVPGGLPLVGVRLDRKATGPGYLARTNAGDLERLDDSSTFDGWSAFGITGTPNSGDGVRLTGGTFDVRSMALTVSDSTAPMAAVGGLRNPAAGTLDLDIRAVDAGIGLGRVKVTLDGVQVAAGSYP